MKRKHIPIGFVIVAVFITSFIFLWSTYKDQKYGKVIDYEIAGKVVDEQTGKGLADVYVTLLYRYDYGHSSGCYGDMVKTNMDGTFRFEKPNIIMREYYYRRTFYFYKDKYLYLYDNKKTVPVFMLTKVVNNEQYLEELHRVLRDNFCSPYGDIFKKYLTVYNTVLRDLRSYKNNDSRKKITEIIERTKKLINRYYERMK